MRLTARSSRGRKSGRLKEDRMPRKFSTWKAGRRLGARGAFVARIFLLMSVGAVVADSHGTLGGVFHVPFAQASHSDHHSSQAQWNNSDESQSGSQSTQTSDESGNSQGDQNGNSQGDENGNGDKDDCGNGDDQSGYQDNCQHGHSHGHHHHHGHHHGD